MENASSITDSIIQTINTIFERIFSSVDNSLYSVLDEITFIGPDILKDKNFENIFGTPASSGILLIANSLLLGVILYFAIKFFLANITYTQVERPFQFIFKLLICGICMNCSFFLIELFLSLFNNLSLAIRELGESLFNTPICFSQLITTINSNLSIDTSSIDIFSLDGIIKGTLSISLLGLVFSYSFRYIMVKIFVLLTPFSFLSLCLSSTTWFFKSWIRNLFSLLLIQVIVSFVLLILFSMDYSSSNLISKFIYVGGIYALIRSNSFVRDFVGGISTTISQSVYNFKK